jgi:hypothetical protein
VLVYRNVSPTTGTAPAALTSRSASRPSAYSTLFEIEGVGISDGKLYFNTNRANSTAPTTEFTCSTATSRRSGGAAATAGRIGQRAGRGTRRPDVCPYSRAQAPRNADGVAKPTGRAISGTDCVSSGTRNARSRSRPFEDERGPLVRQPAAPVGDLQHAP